MFGAPFCFSRVSLGKLASFPESESWSGAKSGAKLRKSANYPGIFQVYPGFVRYTRKILGFLPILLILAPKQPQTRLRALKNDDFHGVSPRKLEGAVEKKRKGTETGCERKSIFSLSWIRLVDPSPRLWTTTVRVVWYC